MQPWTLANWIAGGVGIVAAVLGIVGHIPWLLAGFFIAVAIATILKPSP